MSPPEYKAGIACFVACVGDWSKSIGGGGGVGRSKEGVGHEVLSLVQGVVHAIFSYP